MPPSLLRMRPHAPRRATAGCAVADSGSGAPAARRFHLQLTGVLVEGNVARKGGGLIAAAFVRARLAQCVLRRNRAVDRGGGLSAELSAEVLLLDSALAENGAGRLGGALSFTEDARLQAERCQFVRNTARFGPARRPAAALRPPPARSCSSANAASFFSSTSTGRRCGGRLRASCAWC